MERLIALSDLIAVDDRDDPADRGRAAAGPAHQALSRSARRDGW
ncbi:hypothetical protein [Actinacidiphila glaucinigra]|nr:hypothetical protein [Actinacidiphila glaucinigra]